MTAQIPVVVAGALGRMGAEVIRAVVGAEDCNLVGAIDNTPGKEGADVGLELGLGELEVAVTADFEGCLCAVSQSVRDSDRAAVLVDFTHPSVVYEHTRAAIAYGVHPVIGTTGLTPQQLQDLSEFSTKASIGGAVIPNFSVGMVLLQQAAAAAARFYDHAELTELHHNRKADAPSGTCIKTAELMEELGKNFNPEQVDAFRYRMNDALRAVTKVAVREARTRELRQELLKSEKLKRYVYLSKARYLPDGMAALGPDGTQRRKRLRRLTQFCA